MTQNVVSTKTLIKSSITATFIAAIVLVCIILPAEYNIDPTHIGQKLGLTSLAQQDADKVLSMPQQTESELSQKDIEVVINAGKGVEYKFHMSQHQKMTYDWTTNGESLYFDLHGEPEGDTTGYFESYAIATLNEMKGSFTAPFTGSHGWYWKNNSNGPITVKLHVAGQFSVIGLKQ